MALPIGGRTGGYRAATLARPRASDPGRTERIRNLLLATALASMFLMLALGVIEGAIELPLELLPAELFEFDPAVGLTRLQIIGSGCAAVATLLMLRRVRIAKAGRRAGTLSPAEQAAQAALVAAWTSKANRWAEDQVEVAESLVAAPPSPVEEAVAPPEPAAFVPPQPSSDPESAMDFVRWGQAAARAGDRQVGYRLFAQAVRLDRRNEAAWLWLAGTTDRLEEAINALERVLEINPDNAHARQGLVELLTDIRP